jgi:hypothetical protein
MSPHPSQASGQLAGGATAHPQGRGDDGWAQAQAGDPAAPRSHGAVANGAGGSAASAGAAPRGEGTAELAVRARPPARVATRADARVAEAWPQICERFALQILGHAEHLRPALDQLEADEHDEGRLRWLYQVDHSVTRMRRAARDLRVLAGIEEGDLGGYTSSLMDVIRAAESAIEHYSKVVIGRVVDLAVVPYASDDLSSILAALLDNATNYSPSTVTVSAYLLDSGSVMLRVQDNGIGIPPAHLDVLNAALAGPIPDVNERTGKHTGFPVIHRLARKHGVTVRLASRPDAGGPGGTIAMVTIPPDLLCEVPEEAPAVGGPVEPDLAPEPASPSASGSPERHVSPYAGGSNTSSHLTLARPSEFSDGWKASLPAPVSRTVGGLPRRTRTSLRGEGGRSRSRSGAETSAAARSFADDLTAFTAGDQAARSSRSERPTAGRGELTAPADQEPEGRPAEEQERPDAPVTPDRAETAGRADTSAPKGTGPADAGQARPEGEGR